METDLILTRDVTPQECRWLGRTLPAGTRVKRFSKSTFNCIGHGGVAVSLTGDYPFFELPGDAIEEVSS